MKYYATTFFLLICTINLFSQLETANWIFGINAGLDFNSGELECVDGYPLVANHGSSVLSDSEGNILFYTNGFEVWNKYDEVMPNGILVDSCAGVQTMQNCVIIPRVGHDNQYLLFTLDKFYNGNGGLKYNIVDLLADNGLGDVIHKSVSIQDSLLSGAAVTIHENGIDYWLVIRSLGETKSELNSYLINEFGPTLVSSFNEVLGQSDGTLTGKFSPNGKMLSWAHYIFDFDISNGQITGYRSIYQIGSNQNYNMAEFSPNSKVLYASYTSSTSWNVNQFDLTAPDISETRIALEELINEDIQIKGGIQLALNGKIYISYLDKIGVINSPNSLGVDCGFQQSNIDCPGKARWGFPIFSSHHFNQETTSTLDDLESNITIYPNPTSQKLTVKDNHYNGKQLKLYNSNMKTVLDGDLKQVETVVDISSLCSGLYFLKIYDEDSNVIKKVVVL
ncbi:MAG: hypothetical protein ACI86M_003705 [Saprospiraceae bacterium]|jgi:hypothetical protein